MPVAERLDGTVREGKASPYTGTEMIPLTPHTLRVAGNGVFVGSLAVWGAPRLADSRDLPISKKGRLFVPGSRTLLARFWRGPHPEDSCQSLSKVFFDGGLSLHGRVFYTSNPAQGARAGCLLATPASRRAAGTAARTHNPTPIHLSRGLL